MTKRKKSWNHSKLKHAPVFLKTIPPIRTTDLPRRPRGDSCELTGDYIDNPTWKFERPAEELSEAPVTSYQEGSYLPYGAASLADELADRKVRKKWNRKLFRRNNPKELSKTQCKKLNKEKHQNEVS